MSEESDWFFSITEDQTLVTILGNSNRECNEAGADPYLWLYNDGPESAGELITQDDDGNHGVGQCVSSKIYITLDIGEYRLRAGYYPSQRGLGYNGGTYELVTSFSGASSSIPTTTTSTTTSTTTTSTSTTTTTEVTTSTSTSTTTTTTTLPPTTTTETPTTTTPTSTTTTTTTSSTTTTTQPATTTTTVPATTSTTPQTTTAPTTSIVSTSTTVPTTTTTVSTTTTVVPTTSTSSTLPVRTESSTPSPTPVPNVTTTTLSTSTTDPTTTTIPATSTIPLPQTTTTTTTLLPTTTVPPMPTTSLAPKLVEQPLSSPDAVTEAIDKSDKTDPAQVVHILSSDSISEIPAEEVEQFIKDIDFASFTEEESAEIMEVLSEAPAEIKQAFEQEVNVFGDENFDSYVPTGSAIDIGQRRVLVAAGAAMTAVGATVQGASSSGGSKGGRKVK